MEERRFCKPQIAGSTPARGFGPLCRSNTSVSDHQSEAVRCPGNLERNLCVPGPPNVHGALVRRGGPAGRKRGMDPGSQLGRRNLAPARRNYYIGLLYRETKKERTDTLIQNASLANNLPTGSTAERIAEQFNVSHQTVENAEKFANAVDTLADACGEEGAGRHGGKPTYYADSKQFAICEHG